MDEWRDPAELMTVQEIAEQLGVNVTRVRYWIRRGELGHANHGGGMHGCWLVWSQELAEYLEWRLAGGTGPVRAADVGQLACLERYASWLREYRTRTRSG